MLSALWTGKYRLCYTFFFAMVAFQNKEGNGGTWEYLGSLLFKVKLNIQEGAVHF